MLTIAINLDIDVIAVTLSIFVASLNSPTYSEVLS